MEPVSAPLVQNAEGYWRNEKALSKLNSFKRRGSRMNRHLTVACLLRVIPCTRCWEGAPRMTCSGDVIAAGVAEAHLGGMQCDS
eukprot:1145572-Pelagomonas_calceolata.AAC.2